MTTTTHEASAPARQLSQHILAQIFGEYAQTFDMQAGTVVGNTDARVIYLSQDIIHGIYHTLKHEAGDAWSVILKSCGVVWGNRVCASLAKEMQALGVPALGDLSVPSYIALLERYFARHGWGTMRFDLADAERYGVVRATLSHSLFAETLADVGEPVDQMIAGMLESLFVHISGQALRCAQVAYNSSGKACGEFLISGAERMAVLEALNPQQLTVEQLLAKLRAAG